MTGETRQWVAGAQLAYGALFMDALRSAREAGASDVHIEPTAGGVRLRMRVFGMMQSPWREVEKDHGQALIREVKRLTGLEIGVSGQPQDGRLSVPALKVDLRVNLLPTLHGEKIVLRLLAQDRAFSLAASGLEKEAIDAIRLALRTHNGVVLISGPTGSGKTTTLYSMLAEIDRTRLNIVTLEDPVEYTLDGVNQVRIGGKLTFAAALRAVLRQDPDVIMVGEIRDRETAELVFQAASTGHLVLSTVHANSAAEVVTRLQGLGIGADLLQSNVRFLGAQRLLPRLCGRCSKPVAGTVPARLLGDGCGGCHEGVVGLAAVLEFLTGAEVKAGLKAKELRPNREIGAIARELASSGVIDYREAQGVHET